MPTEEQRKNCSKNGGSSCCKTEQNIGPQDHYACMCVCVCVCMDCSVYVCMNVCMFLCMYVGRSSSKVSYFFSREWKQIET